MEIIILLLIFILGFCCEFIDSSLGMGYGTLMSPILLILGFDIFLVVPSILFSEMLTGFSASLFHHKFKNFDLVKEEKNRKMVIVLSILGVLATILSVFIAVQLPKEFIKLYIGILVIIVGFILLHRKKFKFSWRKMGIIGVLSAFNKSISGGGFGPVVTAGQLVSGRDTKESIGTTTASEFIISVAGFLMYFLLNGLIDFTLAIILAIAGLIATPFGAWGTKKIKNEDVARRLIGIISISLGTFTLIRIFS